MRNKKEIRKLLDEVNTLYYPVTYKFQLIIDNETQDDEEEEGTTVVRFHVRSE